MLTEKVDSIKHKPLKGHNFVITLDRVMNGDNGYKQVR